MKDVNLFKCHFWSILQNSHLLLESPCCVRVYMFDKLSHWMVKFISLFHKAIGRFFLPIINLTIPWPFPFCPCYATCFDHFSILVLCPYCIASSSTCSMGKLDFEIVNHDSFSLCHTPSHFPNKWTWRRARNETLE